MSAVVIQADRERAWPYRPSCYKDQGETKARWMDGCYDRAAPVIQALAAHREAHTAGLVEALDGIGVYCSDTLSGRADAPTDIAWLREGFREVRTRARAALAEHGK